MAIQLHRAGPDDLVRALDPATPRADLVQLAAHRSVTVKAAVAARRDCPLASMLALALEGDLRILEALATNPSATRGVFEALVSHKNEALRKIAANRLRLLVAAA